MTPRTMVAPDLIAVVAELEAEVRAQILVLNFHGVEYGYSYAESVAHGPVRVNRAPAPAGMAPLIAEHFRGVVLDALITTRRVPPSVLR